jgi:peptide/nickel transport system substrate-binding protein
MKGPTPDRNDNPMVDHVKDQFVSGEMSRSGFLRYATLLGVGLAEATAFANFVRPQTAAAAVRAVEAVKPQRGGTLRALESLQQISDPRTVSSVFSANVLRQPLEYLTLTNAKNITRPYLLQKWTPDKQAKVWTLTLRKGIKFHNGQELTSDDVVWNIKGWLDPNVGSSVLGLLAPVLSANDVEKVDRYTVRLHLNRSQVALPEYLFHYAAVILPAGYEPPDIKAGESITKGLIGTGPFILQSYSPQQNAEATRNPNYWQKGADGKALPYLDAIDWIDLGPQSTEAAALAALGSGQADTYYPSAAAYHQFKNKRGFNAGIVPSINVELVVMRTDMAPFTDPKVRQAFKVLQDRKTIANLAYAGDAQLGFDAHFGPADPDFVPMPIPKYDVAKAKHLLASSHVWKAWGNKQLTLVVQDVHLETTIGQAYARMLKKAGVNVKVQAFPPSEYGANWNNYHFSITEWSHRPLNTMVNDLAYTKEAMPTKQNPGGWNETRWVNKEYLAALQAAESTPNLKERKKYIARAQKIQAQDGGIGAPAFFEVPRITNSRVVGLTPHPSDYMLVTSAWIKS